MLELKTCCGACRFEGFGWHYRPCPRMTGLTDMICEKTVNFCPDCGAHLLPNGEIERRGETVGEAWLTTNADGWPGIYADEPQYDGEEWWPGPRVSRPTPPMNPPAPGEKFRVLLVRAEEKPT